MTVELGPFYVYFYPGHIGQKLFCYSCTVLSQNIIVHCMLFCISAPLCSSGPCLNGATCIQDNSTATYTCLCTPDWTGPTCALGKNILGLCTDSPYQQQDHFTGSCTAKHVIPRYSHCTLNLSVQRRQSLKRKL